MHPLAFGTIHSGACGMTAGDRVVYTITGQRCFADEFLSDGDALVTFDDGTFAVVKWNHLRPLGGEIYISRRDALADELAERELMMQVCDQNYTL